ncbi:unnamed protein product [Dovyalis caffra]|uniref:Uncharacterized protein n=1 Tax=Dovyalis caffra TaxID=77055 RepID=A0AAV1RE70_9ROSI|nr:unnamed protein product [Dovyalis caffra]
MTGNRWLHALTVCAKPQHVIFEALALYYTERLVVLAADGNLTHPNRPLFCSSIITHVAHRDPKRTKKSPRIVHWWTAAEFGNRQLIQRSRSSPCTPRVDPRA